MTLLSHALYSLAIAGTKHFLLHLQTKPATKEDRSTAYISLHIGIQEEEEFATEISNSEKKTSQKTQTLNPELAQTVA